MDKINTSIIHRKGGASWRERYSFDFIINGKSLFEMTGANKRDLCGRFSRETPDWNKDSFKDFMLEGGNDAGLGERQFMLFVCPECADLACGAIICTIERSPEGFIWRDFAFDNGYDEGMPDYESYSHIGPYYFDEQTYRRALMNATDTEQSASCNPLPAAEFR